MRPRSLAIANIGPFAGEVVVDFSRLDDVFLVCGDTGSGKTTIFDCVAYALYGSLPGTRSGREGELASHHAKPGDEPSVEFEFESGGTRYSISRKPSRERAKLRGSGLTKEGSEAVLRVLERGAWRVLATGVAEADDAIKRILGFTKDEFLKIVLLPQGEFQRFLEMNSNDRAGLLEKLFPVELHAAVTGRAKTRLDAAQATLKRVDAELDALGAAATPEETAIELERLDGELSAIKADLGAARAEETSRKTGLERAAEIGRAFDLAAETARALASLESEAPAMDALERGIGTAARARELAALLDGLDEKRQAAADAGRQHAEAEARNAGLAAERPAMENAERRLAALATELGSLAERIGTLKSAAAAWERADALGREAARAAAEDEKTAKTSADAARQADAAKAEIARLRAAPGTEDAARAERDKARDEAGRAERTLESAARREELARDLESAAGTLATAEERERILRDGAETAERDLATIQAALDGAAAASLAASLADGAPCPVCGSIHHPNPAVQADDPDALRAALAEARKRRDAAFGALSRSSSESGAASARRAMLQAELDKLPADLPSASDAEAAANAARGALAEAEARLADLEARRRKTEELETRLAGLTAEAERLAAAARATATARAGAESAAEAARAAAGGEDPRPGLAAGEKELRAGTAERERLDKLIVAHRRDSATAAAELAERASALEKATKARDAAEAGADAELARRGFDTAEEARRAAWPEDRLARARRDLAEWRDRLSAAREAATRCAAAVAGRERPDIAAANAGLAEARAAVAALDERLADSTRRKAELAGRAERHRALSAERERLASDNATLVKLSAALNGEVSGRRMTFQTFALGRYFEAVVACAAARLLEMSDGRYRLSMDRQAGKGSSKVGLEILVADAFTGKERPAASLSGGEKFMASISLALGLADVVSNRAAGSPVESVFIDEGFGSLDEDALDRAIDVLDRVREGRMVGIVSHVAELRSRIPSRIEVRKGRSGSAIEIV